VGDEAIHSEKLDTMYAEKPLKSDMENYKNFFQKNGYVVIPGVYSKETVARARKIFDEAFQCGLWQNSPYDSEEIINDIYGHFPELAGLLFNHAYFDTIRFVAGDDVVWLPECAIHRNRYVPWHKDTTVQELNGVTSHFGNDGAMLQVATYFQDNSALAGGGVTVLPGSHLHKDRFLGMYRMGILSMLWRKSQKLFGLSVFHRIERSKKSMDVQSKAGDIVIFDLRIDHRSTNPKESASFDKYAIFNTFGSPTPTLRDYLEFMKCRDEPYYEFFKHFKVPNLLKEIAADNQLIIWE